MFFRKMLKSSSQKLRDTDNKFTLKSDKFNKFKEVFPRTSVCYVHVSNKQNLGDSNLKKNIQQLADTIAFEGPMTVSSVIPSGLLLHPTSWNTDVLQ